MNQAKTGWLVGWFFICMFTVHPAVAMQTQQQATFKDSSGNEKKGFGAEDCKNTSKTLKVEIPKDRDKVKHYSIHKSSSSSSQGSEKLTCTSSETKSVNDLDSFAISTLLTQDICSSKSGGKRDMLICFWDDAKKIVIAEARITYDTTPPDPPTITNAVEGEGEVTLMFQVGNKKSKDITKAVVCYALVTDDVFNQEQEPCPEGTSQQEYSSVKDNFVVVPGLINGSKYAFKIQVTDTSGNQSKWSDIATATPVEMQTPLGEADWKRNPLGMNCSSFGLGAPLWLLWALYRTCQRRRRKSQQGPIRLRNNNAAHRSKTWLAQSGELFGGKQRLELVLQLKNASSVQSAMRQHLAHRRGLQHFGTANFLIALLVAVGFLVPLPLQAAPGQVSLGINGSPYKPDIDRNLTTPVYGKFFGKSSGGPWLPLLGIEANVDLFDGYGTIQLGPALHYTWASGYARKEDGDESQIKLQLHLYQIRPQLTYVFDPYVHVVPIAPYVRAGFIAMGYVFTFDGRLDRHGQHPAGFVLGWDTAFGLLFLLDGVQPGVSMRAKATGIYRHVYLKTELSYAQIDNFGMGGPRLSPKGMFGLSVPLMATFGLLIQL